MFTVAKGEDIRMKIDLKNIALLKKAEVEMNGITVVAGLNGTGKTTIGKSIYATINAFYSLPKRILNSRRNSIRLGVMNALRNNKKLAGDYLFYELINTFMEQVTDDIIISWTKNKSKETMEAFINSWGVDKDYISKEELQRVTESVWEVFKRSDTMDARFLVELYYKNVFSRQINYFHSTEAAEFKMSIDDIELKTSFQKDSLTGYEHTLLSNKRAVYIESHNILDLFNSFRSRFDVRLTNASNDLFELLRGKNNGEEEENELTYEAYIDKKEVKDIIHDIIVGVTHGSLKTDSSDNLLFYDSKLEHPVEISNLSAGLKIFIVLQKLLENGSLHPGDVLLIDEPEINLHPEWQVVFAEILVRLHKELGIIIYVNTHSPYFIRAVEVKMGQNDILNKGKFYLLKQDERGMCSSSDVTGHIEEIYELLYKPLEDL